MAKPIFNDQTIAFNETSRTIKGNILTNGGATDADNDTITVARVDGAYIAGSIGGGKGVNVIQGQYGTLTIAQDGSYTYELNKGVNFVAGSTMVEDFTIKIRDSQGNYDQGVIKFDVAGQANQRPVAIDDFVTTNSTVAGGNVLANDRDPDGDTLHVGGVIDLATNTNYHITGLGNVEIKGVYGTLTINDKGVFSYVVDQTDPDTIALNGNAGVEKFAYKPHDGQNGQGNNTDYAILTIEFNATPGV
ncbi:Ig-like domain-containing protein [Sphingomonas sp. Xoc002]|uniref:Ig-like domain-containing protein n=1 Tax=Sphingomonas sp. Xoc002 TaxID=2837624 RepID=UPI003D168171